MGLHDLKRRVSQRAGDRIAGSQIQCFYFVVNPLCRQLVRIQNAVIIIVDVIQIADAVVIRVVVAEFQIDRCTIDVGQVFSQTRSIRQVEIGSCIDSIRRIAYCDVQVLIKDIESVIGISSFKIIIQTVAIGVFKSRIGRRLTVTAFGNIQHTVVVAVFIQHIDHTIAIGINGHQSFIAADFKRIVQTVVIAVHARGHDEIVRRLSFDVISDAIVVAVQIKMVSDAIAIGVT